MQQLKQCLLAFYLMLFALTAHAGDYIKDSLAMFHSLDSLYNSVNPDDPAQGLYISQRQAAIAGILQVDTLVIRSILNKGNSLEDLGFPDLAMKEYYDALHKAEAARTAHYEADALYDIGMVFANQFDFKQCNSYLTQAKTKYIATGYFSDTIKINFQLGFMRTTAGDFEKGVSIIEDNIRVCHKINNETLLVTGLQDLVQVYFDRKDGAHALTYMLETFRYPAGLGGNVNKATAYNHLVEVYIDMKQWDNARKYLVEAFKYSELANSRDWLYECYLSKSKIEAATGQYKEALTSRIKYIILKDSVYNKNYDDKIAALSSVYELDKKQNQISLLEKDKQISAGKIKQEAWQRNSVIVGSVLIIGLLIAVFLIKIQARTKKLQVAFSRSLIQNQETERQRISRELHDSVGQNILFIKNQLSAQGNNPSLVPVMDTISATIDEVRHISKDLYPGQLEKYGLAAAVDVLAEKVSNTSGIFVSADLHEIEGVLWKDANINLYRIIQEALNNVIKHAGAKAVRITGTKANNKIILAVMDNGKGFDTAILEHKSQRSSGLLNMEERAKLLGGKMELETGATGTKITITIPMQNEV